MQTTTTEPKDIEYAKEVKKPSALKPKPINPKKRSNYDPLIPRKLMEAICDTSTNTLVKLESEGLITPYKVKHGGLDYVTYSIEDLQKVLKYKKISFKKKKEAEVISIFSQKGGVGKSAFTQHLGSIMSLVGRVLIVDLDAQSDATILLGLDANYGDLVDENSELEPTIADLMDWSLNNGDEAPYKKLNAEDVIKNISPTLDVIPADLELGEINYSLNRLRLKPRMNSQGKPEPAELHIIKEVLDSFKYLYDFIIVDCPPNIETCNVSALFASNRIIVPLELEAKSLTTMRRNYLFLERLKELHPGFNWDKILVVRNKMRKETIKIKASLALEERYTDSDFITLSEVVIPNSSIIDKCSDWKKPVYSVTSRFGTTSKHSIPQAQEFTNFFWAIMHELLDIDLEKLVFDQDEHKGR